MGGAVSAVAKKQQQRGIVQKMAPGRVKTVLEQLDRGERPAVVDLSGVALAVDTSSAAQLGSSELELLLWYLQRPGTGGGAAAQMGQQQQSGGHGGRQGGRLALRLGECSLGPFEVGLVASALEANARSFHSLDLRGNDITAGGTATDGLDALAGAVRGHPTLEVLDLSGALNVPSASKLAAAAPAGPAAAAATAAGSAAATAIYDGAAERAIALALGGGGDAVLCSLDLRDNGGFGGALCPPDAQQCLRAALRANDSLALLDGLRVDGEARVALRGLLPYQREFVCRRLHFAESVRHFDVRSPAGAAGGALTAADGRAVVAALEATPSRVEHACGLELEQLLGRAALPVLDLSAGGRPTARFFKQKVPGQAAAEAAEAEAERRRWRRRRAGGGQQRGGGL